MPERIAEMDEWIRTAENVRVEFGTEMALYEELKVRFVSFLRCLTN